MITALCLSPAVDKIYLTDNFKAGGLYRVHDIVRSAGGKGVNVARVASILGEEVMSLGFKGGNTGEWLEGQLLKFGIDTRLIPVEGESRTNNNIIDRINGTETEILEIGPHINGLDIEKFFDSFKSALPGTDVLVCSGGLPDGVSADFYGILIGMARSRGIITILDASNDVLEESIRAKPYLIKPNLRELGRIAGRQLKGTEDIIDACRDITAAGVEAVLASLGKDGALLVTCDEVLEVCVPDITVVNTIGSGDSMVAGCAAALRRGYSLERMLVFASACAVANTQFTEIGYVSLELVERYEECISINVILRQEGFHG